MKGEFEPHILKKNQADISRDIGGGILPMYAKEMSTGDIENHIRDIRGIAASDTMEAESRTRPSRRERMAVAAIGEHLPVVFLGAIHYHVHSEVYIVKKAKETV